VSPSPKVKEEVEGVGNRVEAAPQASTHGLAGGQNPLCRLEIEDLEHALSRAVVAGAYGLVFFEDEQKANDKAYDAFITGLGDIGDEEIETIWRLVAFDVLARARAYINMASEFIIQEYGVKLVKIATIYVLAGMMDAEDVQEKAVETLEDTLKSGIEKFTKQAPAFDLAYKLWHRYCVGR